MNTSTATTNTPTTTETTTTELHTMMSRAAELVCLIESCELMGFGGDTVNMYEDLAHLETSIEIAIANELDDEMDDEDDGEWHPANLPDEVLMAQAEEAAAEGAKMARDVQEYQNSLINVPF